MTSSSSLQGKVIWLTGASSGIGAALAPLLSARGARLILSARRGEALRDVQAQCAGEAQVLPVDLGVPESLPRLAEEAWSAFDGIDVVIHNAALSHRDSTAMTSLEVDRHLMEVNYFGPVALTKALLPKMMDRKAGRFVVISSVSGVFGVARRSASSAARHALHGFFESLRAETHAAGLRSSMIVPGAIGTDLSDEACAEEVVRAIEAGRSEALVGGSAMVGVTISRLFPRLWRWIMRHHPLKVLSGLAQRLGLTRAAPALGK